MSFFGDGVATTHVTCRGLMVPSASQYAQPAKRAAYVRLQ